MKYILSVLFVATLSTIGCVDATVEVENVCSSKSFTIPGVSESVSAFVGERTVRRDTKQDIGSTLAKMSDIGELKLTSAYLTFNGNGELSFVHHVKAILHSEYGGDLLLADTDVVADSTTVNVPISTDQDRMLVLLKRGQVTLQVFATGNIPTVETVTTNSFCVGVSAHTNKSLGDL